MKNIMIIFLAFILSFPNNDQILHRINNEYYNRLIEVERPRLQITKPIRLNNSARIQKEVRTYIEHVNKSVEIKKEDKTEIEEENPKPEKSVKKETTKKIKKDVKETLSVSKEDIRLLALICMAEAEGECEYGQRLVIDTILNRVDSDKFPNSIYGVIYQKNQFTSMWNGRVNRVKPTDKFYKLAEEELRKRSNYDCIFFTAGQYSNYGKPMFRVENHYFSSYK